MDLTVITPESCHPSWFPQTTDVQFLGIGTTIIPESWYPNWFPQKADVQFLRVGTLSQAKQSTRWVEYIESEGQRIRVNTYEVNIAVNLWVHDLLQQ